MRIGAHVRTSKGLVDAVTYARSVGCETMQIFAKTPLQWHAPERDERDLSAFRSALAEHGMTLAATHGAYLVNLASLDEELWLRSIDALADEIVRAADLGAPAVVTHLGSAPGSREHACLRVAAAATRALQMTDGCAAGVFLENSSGSGRTLGSSSEEIIAVFDAIPASLKTRVAVCVDTCHAHVAGYDLSTPSGWRTLLSPFARAEARVALVHANDALYGCGSRRDRHAWVGEGTIGEAGFALLFEQEQLSDADVVVEMPGTPPTKDALNVARLKELRDR